MSAPTTTLLPTIAFIGGGNMASAILGGLIHQGLPVEQLEVIEPWEPARAALQQQFGVLAQAHAGPQLEHAEVVVWAIKPQTFKEAALATGPYTSKALHLSVAAGVRSSSIAHWLGSERVVRAMPNTPALIGQGISGLYARPSVNEAERQLVAQIMASTGEHLWVQDEAQLDAVTALSGSGPAYVFYFLEAMVQAGVEMGLSAAQAEQLAISTFAGASELARRSHEPPAMLRERVTSKGGTTYAALEAMRAAQLDLHFMEALRAAQARAHELGDACGD